MRRFLRRALGQRLLPARVQATQPLGQQGHAGQAAQGIAIGGLGDIVGQQAVGNVALPARHQRPLHVAHQQLVQHDSQGKHIAALRRCAAGKQFGCNIHGRALRHIAADAVRARHAQLCNGKLIQPARFEQARAAKVGQTRLPACRHWRDQDILRLQVLVQHAHAMRRGHGIGDLQEQRQTRRAIELRQASILPAPLQQIVAAKLAFHEKRRLFKIPVQHHGDVGARPQFIAQEARNRRFPLQRGQILRIGGKLEHAALAAGRFAGQPDFARSGLAEDALQAEMIPPRHGLSGRQGDLAFKCLADHYPVAVARNAVTLARHGLDETCMRLAEGIAQAVDGRRQGLLAGRTALPDDGLELAARDNFMASRQQGRQQGTALGMNFRPQAIHRQLAAGLVKLDRPKTVAIHIAHCFPCCYRCTNKRGALAHHKLSEMITNSISFLMENIHGMLADATSGMPHGYTRFPTHISIRF